MDLFTISLMAAALVFAGYILLAILVMPVDIRGEEEAYRKGLTDTTQNLGFIPLHTRFFHPATTRYWRAKGMGVFLSAARLCLGLGLLLLLTVGGALVIGAG